MRNALSSIIRYYRSCYQADYRAVHLLNFFSNKVSHALFLNSAELLEGKHLQFPVPTEWGRKVAANLQLHAKEKALYTGSFFLVGRTQLLGKRREVAAPLYLHPTQLEWEGEVYYLSIDANQAIINPAFVEVLKDQEEGNQGLYETLVQDLPVGFIDFDELHQIENILRKYFPQLLLDAALEYPHLINEEQLKATLKKQRQGFQVLPALGIGTLDKASGSLGILNELQDMSSHPNYSQPLISCFAPMPQQRPSIPPARIRLPVTLSASQENILQQVPHNDISLIIGPPGTGKSFTIAALAADRLSQGESVLIASKNLQAVNVVAHKIEQEMGLNGVVVKAGRKDYRKHLRKRLQDWLHGFGVHKYSTWDIQKKQGEVRQLTRQITKLEQMLSLREQYERKHGQQILTGENSWWQRLSLYILKRRLVGILPMWDLWLKLEDRLQHLHQHSRELLEMYFHLHLFNTLNAHRKDLQTFLRALKSKTGQLKENLFQKVNFQRVLDALPIWIVNTADVNRVLPLQKELFDLVIIDEASQCDIASALPLLQRAKRAVIVGDPKQLRHISFLSRARQSQMADQLQIGHLPEEKLAYRDKSLLDLVSDAITHQGQVFLLDEHFRSLPEIIAFSNQHFYEKQLKIMTATPETLREKAVFLHPIEGERSRQGYNKVEAEAIVNFLLKLTAEEKPLAPELCQTIGIISPFRDQVNYLRKRLSEQISDLQLSRHKVLVGTPFEFQGEERDIILLSFTIDSSTPSGVFRYLDREDVFNVAITRARTAQHLFLSINPAKVPSQNLLGKYLRFVSQERVHSSPSQHLPPQDLFMDEVIGLLKEWGIQSIYQNYLIAGVEIDLVIVHEERTYCIDLVGYPGYYERALPISRWKLLDRIGLKTFAMPYSHWKFEHETCIEALAEFLGIQVTLEEVEKMLTQAES